MVESGDVKIWDLSTGRGLDLPGHTAPVWGLASSPAGRRLVTGSHDRTIKLTAPLLSVRWRGRCRWSRASIPVRRPRARERLDIPSPRACARQ